MRMRPSAVLYQLVQVPAHGVTALDELETEFARAAAALKVLRDG